jgi:hypothetical protein
MNCQFCTREIKDSSILCEWCGRRQDAPVEDPLPARVLRVPQASARDPLLPTDAEMAKETFGDKRKVGRDFPNDWPMRILFILFGLSAAILWFGAFHGEAGPQHAMYFGLGLLTTICWVGIIQRQMWAWWVGILLNLPTAYSCLMSIGDPGRSLAGTFANGLGLLVCGGITLLLWIRRDWFE